MRGTHMPLFMGNMDEELKSWLCSWDVRVEVWGWLASGMGLLECALFCSSTLWFTISLFCNGTLVASPDMAYVPGAKFPVHQRRFCTADLVASRFVLLFMHHRFATSFGRTHGVAYASCKWMSLSNVNTDVFVNALYVVRALLR